MTEEPNSYQEGRTPTTPAPLVKKKAGPSLVWIVPLIAALVGGWLVVKTLTEQGPQITISFKTAEGIEAGKTKVKYKNVDIGVVNSVAFNDDFNQIILQVDMDKTAEHFLLEGASFWVVKPRLGLREISGLDTLFSGSYIKLRPGEGAEQRHFKGLEIPPIPNAGEGGRKIVLKSEELGSLTVGSPIYYHGIRAGEVLEYKLGDDHKSLIINTYINPPYASFVKSNSNFWSISGVDISLNADGLSLRSNSIQSMLIGGIAFETPEETEENVGQNPNNKIFTLYEGHKQILEGRFTQKIHFVLFFEGSVRGLQVGAPVEFKGIKVGSVVDIHLEFDESSAKFNIPVVIEIEPERVIARKDGAALATLEVLKTLVESGLRARLQTGSLITGQLYVELDMLPDTPIRLVNADNGMLELPTAKAQLEEMTTSVNDLLKKLNKLDIEKINSELIATLEGTKALTNAPELKQAISDLSNAMNAFKKMAVNLDGSMPTMTRGIADAATAGQHALEKSQKTLGLLNEVLLPESPLQYRFIQMAEEITEMARATRLLMDYIERNPDSLIFGKVPPEGR